jgi:hypothetical protein
LDRVIQEQIDSNSIRYLNKFGYPSDRDGNAFVESNAAYVTFKTPYTTQSNHEIIGWLFRSRSDTNYTGVTFGTLRDFREHIKDATAFRMGEMIFDNWNDAIIFLEDIAGNTIPETWTYNYHKSGIPHPILKSYLENIFEKLKMEDGKILASDDNKYIIFNSNLLDRYFHDVFIIAEVQVEEGETLFTTRFDTKDFVT